MRWRAAEAAAHAGVPAGASSAAAAPPRELTWPMVPASAPHPSRTAMLRSRSSRRPARSRRQGQRRGGDGGRRRGTQPPHMAAAPDVARAEGGGSARRLCPHTQHTPTAQEAPRAERKPAPRQLSAPPAQRASSPHVLMITSLSVSYTPKFRPTYGTTPITLGSQPRHSASRPSSLHGTGAGRQSVGGAAPSFQVGTGAGGFPRAGSWASAAATPWLACRAARRAAGSPAPRLSSPLRNARATNATTTTAPSGAL